jgi:hypothetical protein
MPDNKITTQANPDTGIDPAKIGRRAEQSGTSSQRRKLIKASAAAIPAVMTLRSGAAAAVGSTYGCTTHDNTVAQEVGVAQVLDPDSSGGLTHDHWIRVPGKRVEANPPGGGSTTVIVYCVETGSGGGSSAPTWNCYNEDGTPYMENLAAEIIEKGDNVALLAYLEFDQYGNDLGSPELFYPVVQTVQPAPPGYSPLTYSCLSSIHPNLTLLGGEWAQK